MPNAVGGHASHLPILRIDSTHSSVPQGHGVLTAANFMHRWQHYDELTELQIMCASTTSYVDEVETGLADILFRHFKAE